MDVSGMVMSMLGVVIGSMLVIFTQYLRYPDEFLYAMDKLRRKIKVAVLFRVVKLSGVGKTTLSFKPDKGRREINVKFKNTDIEKYSRSKGYKSLKEFKKEYKSADVIKMMWRYENTVYLLEDDRKVLERGCQLSKLYLSKVKEF